MLTSIQKKIEYYTYSCLHLLESSEKHLPKRQVNQANDLMMKAFEKVKTKTPIATRFKYDNFKSYGTWIALVSLLCLFGKYRSICM